MTYGQNGAQSDFWNPFSRDSSESGTQQIIIHRHKAITESPGENNSHSRGETRQEFNRIKWQQWQLGMKQMYLGQPKSGPPGYRKITLVTETQTDIRNNIQVLRGG